MSARSEARGCVLRLMGVGEATPLERIESPPSGIASRRARQTPARDPRSEGNP